MTLPFSIVYIRLFIRLLLGLILLSVGMSKLAHPRRFQRGIQDYKLIPPVLESRLALSALSSYCVPLAELVAGLGLVFGLLLTPAIILALGLLALFGIAISINLMRGRSDLSCHCGGTLGNHRISWWLVGRNSLLMVALLVLLLIPSDRFTIETVVRSPSTTNKTFQIVYLARPQGPNKMCVSVPLQHVVRTKLVKSYTSKEVAYSIITFAPAQ